MYAYRLLTAAVVSLVPLAASPIAGAALPTIGSVEIGPELRKNLDKDYGPREDATLQRCVTRGLERAFARRGVELESGTRVAVTIDEAKPSHPTFYQQSRNPSLDGFRSVSLGGAKFKGQLLASDGRVLRTIEHQRYAWDIRDAARSADPWGDACDAARQFADKVARAAATL